jgi:RNA polymerase sigma-70 factor, ECF subfamily
MEASQFHRLFLENQQQLFSYVLALLPCMQQAEEVFQNACVIILSKADQFEPGTEFLRWACQIAKFEVYNFRRRSSSGNLTLSSSVLEMLAEREPPLGSHSETRQRALRRCLDSLSTSDRRLIEARYAESASSRELAKKLSLQENTVYKALGRIRRALRRCVDARIAQEGHT